VRLAESSLTAVAYLYAGLYTIESFALIPWIVPSIAIGVPIGAQVIQRVRPETFRRLCMSFDAWIVGFGLSTLVREMGLVDGPPAFIILAAVGATDMWLLYRFFSIPRPHESLVTEESCSPPAMLRPEADTYT
jgi:uncharacterized protein